MGTTEWSWISQTSNIELRFIFNKQKIALSFSEMGENVLSPGFWAFSPTQLEGNKIKLKLQEDSSSSFPVR